MHSLWAAYLPPTRILRYPEVKVDWDHLRFVLMVDREGGLAGAARALGIDYSTAHRRLAGIERRLGMRLFQRLRSGYRLTSQGEAVADTARRIEADVLSVERKVIGTDQKLTGTVRVGTSQLLGLYLLPELIDRFLAQYPEVTIALSIHDELSNLRQRDADVVIRGTSTPPPYLVGRSIAPIRFSGYIRRDMLRGARQHDAAGRDWIGFDNGDPRAPLARWLEMLVPAARKRLTVDSAAGLREAAAHGLGAAVLPCLTGDALPELARIGETRMEPGFDLWILSHADLHRNARIRAFTLFMEAALSQSPLVRG